MKITTKYSLNQKVWKIIHEKERKYLSCPACEGNGSVILKDNKKRLCPECYGNKGKYHYFDLKWIVKSELTIGEVRFSIRNIERDDTFDNIRSYKKGNNKIEESYMAYETGIGSGSVHYVTSFYPTEESAQKECDKRNEVKND